jgi:hypothetical protein
VTRGVKSGSLTDGMASMVEPSVLAAVSTAGRGRHPRFWTGNRRALAEPRNGARRPAQYLFELQPGAFARPAAALLEGDQRTGIDDTVGGQAALADVELAPARSRRRSGTDQADVELAGSEIELRIGHLRMIP